MSSENPTPQTKVLSAPKVKMVKVKDLKKASTNVRQEYPEEAQNALADSIGDIGLLEFPKVTPDGKVIAGWGRVQACIKNDIEEIPVVVLDLNVKDQIIASLAENESRSNLFRYESRDAVKKLSDTYGMSQRAIAKSTGLSYSTVAALLSLDKLPEPVKEKAGDIPAFTTHKIVQITGSVDDDQEVAAKAIELATTVSPSGKRMTKETLDHIFNMASPPEGMTKQKTTVDDVKNALTRSIQEAKNTEYRTMSMSLPEDLYNIIYKYSLFKKLTIQEVIIEKMKAIEDKMKKEMGY